MKLEWIDANKLLDFYRRSHDEFVAKREEAFLKKLQTVENPFTGRNFKSRQPRSG